jgi:hypothetical protein
LWRKKQVKKSRINTGVPRDDEIEAVHTTETKGCALNINIGSWSCASLAVRSIFAEK